MRFLVVALVFLTGCASIQISNYINAEHPYSRRIYASYDKVLDAVRTVVAQEHFKITAEVDPSVYEQDERYEHKDLRNVLIFTDIKQMPRIAYSKYIHMNIYIRSLADSVEVEVRFAKATSILMKQFKSTKNDVYVNHVLDNIEDEAGTK